MQSNLVNLSEVLNLDLLSVLTPRDELLKAWLALTIVEVILKPIGCHGI